MPEDGIHGAQRDDKPFDSMTELASQIIEATESKDALPEGHRMIVMVTDGETSGIGVEGYDGEMSEMTISAITDMMIHLKGLLNSAGKDFQIIPMDGPIGQG